MSFDLTAQGWTSFINGFIAGLFLLIPQFKAWFYAKPDDYQVSMRGLFSIAIALLFVGGSCVGLWNDVACTKADIWTFIGNVVIASVLGFKVSGSVLHVKSTVQAVRVQRALMVGRRAEYDIHGNRIN